MTSVPDVPSALSGWRAWVLGRSEVLEPQLVSPVQRSVWPPGRAAVARCKAVPGSRTHDPPVSDCGCGLYAVTDPGRMMGVKVDRGVLGVVALWGDVVEGTMGWRASHGYPRLLIADPGIGSRALNRLGDRYGVPLHVSPVPLPELVALLATTMRAHADRVLRDDDAWLEIAEQLRGPGQPRPVPATPRRQ